MLKTQIMNSLNELLIMKLQHYLKIGIISTVISSSQIFAQGTKFEVENKTLTG